MNKYNFKRRDLASGPYLLGLLLIMAGLFALVSPLIFEVEISTTRVLVVGGGAIAIGVLLSTTYKGTLIDLSGKRVKEYQSVCGYSFGEWRVLPDILTVKVISATYVSTNIANGISPTLSMKLTDFMTYLYSDASQPVLSFVYSNREKAVSHAKLLADSLNAKLVLHIREEG